MVEIVAQFAVGEAIGREGVNDRIGVAEIIIEEGADDVGRQRVADVADLLAHLIPGVRHRRCLHTVLQVDEYRGVARLGVAANEIEARHFFQLLLDAVGDVANGFISGCPRPEGADHHGLDGEWRIFLAAKLEIGEVAGNRRYGHQVNDEALVTQRPFRKIEAAHGWVSSANRHLLPFAQLVDPGGDDDVALHQSLRNNDLVSFIAANRHGFQCNRGCVRLIDPNGRAFPPCQKAPIPAAPPPVLT